MSIRIVGISFEQLERTLLQGFRTTTLHVFIQDPVLYHMILRSGQRVIDSTYAPFTHSNSYHYIITLPESNCVCSVSLGPSVWKDGYQHSLQITDPYRIHVALAVDKE